MRALDPVAIRKALVVHRSNRSDWPAAWLDVVGTKPTFDPDTMDEAKQEMLTLRDFMEDHFRAAYYKSDSSLGRCTVPDWTGIANFQLPSEYTVRTRRASRVRPEMCRSGDECNRQATRGRFGPTFCEHHGAELERIAERVNLDTPRANPTVNRNSGIIKRSAARAPLPRPPGGTRSA